MPISLNGGCVPTALCLEIRDRGGRLPLESYYLQRKFDIVSNNKEESTVQAV
jgi:hypothetical protein